MKREYVFGAEEDLAREQLEILGRLWDGYTERAIEGIGIGAGARCLDIGAGAGTVTRMLTDRVGPRGTVLAVDIDPTHFEGSPGAELIVRDINDGVPVAGPYDLIHVRLVLMHLSRRAEILTELVQALAPGGWLVVADNGQLPQIIAAPDQVDVEVFDRFQDLAVANASRLGVSFEWADEIDRHMVANGLVEVHGTSAVHSGPGGSLEARLSYNYVRQMQASLLEAGIPTADVQRYREMWLDPRYRFWFYAFACWAGQRPL